MKEKELYFGGARGGGGKDAMRAADKLMGLTLQEVLIKIAEAVRGGYPDRVVGVLKTAAHAKFLESLGYALKGNIKL